LHRFGGFAKIDGYADPTLDATPVGVETLSPFDPKVAAQRGNPGLNDITALRYKSLIIRIVQSFPEACQTLDHQSAAIQINVHLCYKNRFVLYPKKHTLILYYSND
jgi:hypothetical protein